MSHFFFIRYDGKNFEQYTTANGLAYDWVTSITEDQYGYLWFGTSHPWTNEGGGITRFDGTQFTTFTTKDGLADNKVYNIIESKNGDLWIGTGNGLSRFRDNKFTTYTTKNGLIHNRVLSLMEDSHGDLWLGTIEGVSRYNGRSFTNFTIHDGLAYNMVLRIIEDRHGHLWFATWGGGVSHYDGAVFQNLSNRDGLGSNMVAGLLEDRHGNLWFGTENGLTKFRPNYTIPGIQITDVLTLQPHGAIKSLEISTSQSFFTIHFEGKSYKTRPEQMKFAYRLKGLQDSWQITGRSWVRYQELPRGDYTFEVKAIDRDLVYSDQPATLKLKITPPYRQMALWGGLSFSLIITCIVSYYAIQKRRDLHRLQQALMREMEEELQRLANHDPLTGLPSLRLCRDRLENAIAFTRRNDQPTALMFIDLDGFKAVNDTLGHNVGDAVLIETARRLQNEIRETDTVARMGG
ncbi:MAG: diguanylate cyclase, partial [Candidatus Latescibacteria bacterium]|nr:diguanylate cyclase [Candidatus Latescibacterota bacterium]